MTRDARVKNASMKLYEWQTSRRKQNLVTSEMTRDARVKNASMKLYLDAEGGVPSERLARSARGAEPRAIYNLYTLTYTKRYIHYVHCDDTSHLLDKSVYLSQIKLTLRSTKKLKPKRNRILN